MSNIIYNCIRTPDGTLLHSKSVHDYITHVDANGEEYMNDGGNCYLRRNVNKEPYTELTVYSDEPIEEVREVFSWGTYGESQDYSKGITFVVLKSLSNAHIIAILDTQTHLPEWRREIFRRELAFREANNIFIKDTYEDAAPDV